MEIKQKLKKLRQDCKLTQTEVAEYLGISAQTVSKWERGLLSPDILLLPKLAVLYRCSIDSIFEMESSWGVEHRKEFEARIDELDAKKDYDGVYRAWIQEIELQPDRYESYPIVMRLVLVQELFKDEYLRKLLSLAEHAERYCFDDHIRNDIYRLMLLNCSHAKSPDIKEKTAVYYQKLPMLRHSREFYAQAVMEGEAYTKQLKSNIIHMIDHAELMVRQLITPEMSPEEKLFYYKKAAALYELVLDGKYGRLYDMQMLYDYSVIVSLSMKIGEIGQAQAYMTRFLPVLERQLSENERKNHSLLLADTGGHNVTKMSELGKQLLSGMLHDPNLEMFKEEISAVAERYFAYFQ